MLSGPVCSRIARLPSAYFVVARRGKNASAPSSSARRARDFRRSQTHEYFWFQGKLATIGPCRLRLSGCLGEGRRTVID